MKASEGLRLLASKIDGGCMWVSFFLGACCFTVLLLGQERSLMVKSTSAALAGIWVQFPAPTWWLTTICNSSSRRPDTFFWTPETQDTKVVPMYSWRQSTHPGKK